MILVKMANLKTLWSCLSPCKHRMPWMLISRPPLLCYQLFKGYHRYQVAADSVILRFFFIHLSKPLNHLVMNNLSFRFLVSFEPFPIVNHIQALIDMLRFSYVCPTLDNFFRLFTLFPCSPSKRTRVLELLLVSHQMHRMIMQL